MTDSINEQHMFAPHDVAGMFGVSVMTIRRWADYHKAHLSDSANPQPGKSRAFSWADVEKFKQIKIWRDEGLSVDAINNRLTGAITEVITPTVMDDSLAVSVGSPDAPEAAQAVVMALDAINTMQRRFEALEASVKDAKRERQNTTLTFLLGLTSGIVLVVGLLALAALWLR